MPGTFPLQKYQEKIQLIGQLTPDIKTLIKIYSAHLANIPYQNFDLWMAGRKPSWQRKPVDISPEKTRKQLLEDNLGGCCFHTVDLLHDALSAIGYDVQRSQAWVLLGNPRQTSKPSTHEIVFVTLDGELWLLDPGFGAKSPRFPINLSNYAHGEQIIQQGFDTFRLAYDGKYRLDMLVDYKWLSLYEFYSIPCDSEILTNNNNKLTYYPIEIGIRDLYLLIALTTQSERKSLMLKEGVFTYKSISAVGIRTETIAKEEFSSCVKTNFGITVPKEVLDCLNEKMLKIQRRHSFLNTEKAYAIDDSIPLRTNGLR